MRMPADPLRGHWPEQRPLHLPLLAEKPLCPYHQPTAVCDQLFPLHRHRIPESSCKDSLGRSTDGHEDDPMDLTI